MEVTEGPKEIGLYAGILPALITGGIYFLTNSRFLLLGTVIAGIVFAAVARGAESTREINAMFLLGLGLFAWGALALILFGQVT